MESKIKHIDYVKIEIKYRVTLYRGFLGVRGGVVHRTFESSAEDYGKIEYQGPRTEDKLNESLTRMFRALEDRIEKNCNESEHWELEFLEYNHWIVNEKTVNEAARDPTKIKMKRVLPINYKFIEGVNLNIPKQDGYCTDEYLIKTFPELHLTTEKLDEVMRPVNDLDFGIEGIEKKEYNGRTAQEVQRFCDYYSALDLRNLLFFKSVHQKKGNIVKH